VWALFLHEAYRIPECSATTKSGWSFVDFSLWDDTMLSETWDFIFLEPTFVLPPQFLQYLFKLSINWQAAVILNYFKWKG
jgi:hypothetical protein